MSLTTALLWLVEAVVVFVASTTIFDVLHYLLHRWQESPIPLLRTFSRMHWVHHKFLTLEMKIDSRYRWANIWAHVIPEYLTGMAGTVLFLFVFPWQPVAAIAAIRTVFLAMTLKEEGMDFNHMAMDRVGGRQGLLWVDQNYHAMHHLYPNQFFSSFANVFDILFGTACQFEGRRFLITGANGAYGRAIRRRVEARGGIVETAKWGADFGPEDYDRLGDKLARADVLVLAHGAKTEGCRDGNYLSFVALIDRFIAAGRGRVTPPEVWALGSEAELHGDLGDAGLRDYVASKRDFAARARQYYASDELIYRHIVPCSFTSPMGRGLISADMAASISLFFITRAFRYVPVTLTTLAFWNYFRFRALPAGDEAPV